MAGPLPRVVDPLLPTAPYCNVRRVGAAGAGLGFEVRPRAFVEHIRTAEDAARAIGVEVAQIVKSLVFLADGPPPSRFREATGYPIGGIPPFGHVSHLATFVDLELLAHREVWAAAGTPNVNFAIAPDELVRITGGLVCDLARR